MSWNLIIYRPGKTPEQLEPLGEFNAVKTAFSAAFLGLEWESPKEATLPVDGGFQLEFTEEDGIVQDVYTHGGYNHIRQFAALCKRNGWRMADAQEGEDVDLEDPQKWYDERGG